jgi:hypothetical protein
MEIDWSVDREGDASLVGVRVRNDAEVPRRVRIESRHEAPVLPPRRGGVVEPGWDAGGVTAVIDPGARAAFGFATLGDPVDPPVEVTADEPAPSADEAPGGGARATGGDRTARARTAARRLADHRPPRDAVTEEVPGGERGAAEADGPAAGTGVTGVEASDPVGGEASGSTGDGPGVDDAPVDAWFAAVEARIERAERLAGGDVEAATAVVEEAGGIEAVVALDERVAADAERLRAVRDRAASLAERAGESDVPTDALEALA